MYFICVKTLNIEKRRARETQIAEYLNYRSMDDYYVRECGTVPISDVDLAILAKLLDVPASELTATIK